MCWTQWSCIAIHTDWLSAMSLLLSTGGTSLSVMRIILQCSCVVCVWWEWVSDLNVCECVYVSVWLTVCVLDSHDRCRYSLSDWLSARASSSPNWERELLFLWTRITPCYSAAGILQGAFWHIPSQILIITRFLCKSSNKEHSHAYHKPTALIEQKHDSIITHEYITPQK